MYHLNLNLVGTTTPAVVGTTLPLVPAHAKPAGGGGSRGLRVNDGSFRAACASVARATKAKRRKSIPTMLCAPSLENPGLDSDYPELP